MVGNWCDAVVTAQWCLWLWLAYRARFTRVTVMALVALAVALAGLSAGLSLASASLLSTQQTNARDFGRYTQRISVPMGNCNPSTECPIEALIPSLVQRAGGTAHAVSRTAISVPVDTPRAQVALEEAPWNDRFWPETYRLTSGRWPSAPGEVVIPAQWAGTVHATMTVYADAVRLRIVGVVEDRFNTASTVLPVAPGTIAHMVEVLSQRRQSYRLPDQTLTVRMTGTHSQRFENSLATAIAPMTGTDVHAVTDAVTGATMVRSAQHDTWTTTLNRLPVSAGWLPLLVVPFLFSMIVAFTGATAFARSLQLMSAIGLRRSKVTIAATVLWALAITTTAALSVVAGSYLSRLLRPVVQHTLTRPLSPPMPNLYLVVVVTGLVLAGLAPSFVVSQLGVVSAKYAHVLARMSAIGRVGWRGVQFVGLALGTAFIVSTLSGNRLINERDMLRWVIAVCMVSALAVGVLVASIRGGRQGRLPLPATLALRRLHAASGSTVAVIVVVMTAVALPLSVGIMLTTSEYRSNLTRVSQVPEGQVVLGLNHMYDGGLPPSIKKSFEAYTGLSEPLWTRQAKVDTGELMQGLPYVMDSAADVERLIGHPLDAAQKKVFDSGGLLVPQSPGNQIREGQIIATRTPDGRDTGPLRTTLIDGVPDSYLVGNLGFVSMSKAKSAGWPLDNGYATYTGVYGVRLEAALRAPAVLRFDPKTVLVYDVPPPITMPPALDVARRACAVLLGLLVFFVSMRYVADTRQDSRVLEVVGVPGRTRFITVVLMIVLSIALPLTIGHYVAVWANEAAWHQASHDNIGAMVPWSEVRSSLRLNLVLTGVATALAMLVNSVRRPQRRGVS